MQAWIEEDKDSVREAGRDGQKALEEFFQRRRGMGWDRTQQAMRADLAIWTRERIRVMDKNGLIDRPLKYGFVARMSRSRVRAKEEVAGL